MRSLQAIAARVDKLALAHRVDEDEPDPDDPHYMAWAVERYGLAQLLAELLEREDRPTARARRRRRNGDDA